MIEKISYRGWKNVWRLSNGIVELIVLADVGPRILRYAYCGAENILHEVSAERGQTGGKDFRLYGGHRLWVWPEVARTYFPDNCPVKVTENAAGICFVAPFEDSPPGTHLQKEIEIKLDSDATRVRITHSITNHAEEGTQLSVWCPTMMRAGGVAILPLAARVAMDPEHYQSVAPLTLWSFTDFADPRWTLGSEFIQLRQKKKFKGRFSEQMSGTFNPAGWGAYYRKGTLFVKHAAPQVGARYPDFGCNFEVFTNLEFLELETLSPLVELKPGESSSHTETWALFRDVPPGKGDDWIRSIIAPLATSIGGPVV